MRFLKVPRLGFDGSVRDERKALDGRSQTGITAVLDDWAFRFPGIDDVEHAYFHAVTAAAPDTIRDYLDQAFELGRKFDREPNTPPDPSATRAGTPGELGD